MYAIRNWHDAEVAACLWMRTHGFRDASLTAGGADGGVDIRSIRAVAQVKADMRPTGRPTVQALKGVAATEGKAALLFTMAGLTAEAAAWAERASVGHFTFDYLGDIRPQNAPAKAVVRWHQLAEAEKRRRSLVRYDPALHADACREFAHVAGILYSWRQLNAYGVIRWIDNASRLAAVQEVIPRPGLPPKVWCRLRLDQPVTPEDLDKYLGYDVDYDARDGDVGDYVGWPIDLRDDGDARAALRAMLHGLLAVGHDPSSLLAVSDDGAGLPTR